VEGNPTSIAADGESTVAQVRTFADSATADQARAARTDRRTGSRRALSALRRGIVPVLILAVWQIQASRHAIDTRLFSSPEQVAQTLWSMTRDGTLPDNLLPSLRRAGLGLLIGVSLGTATGLACGLWTPMEEALDSTIQMLRTIPFVSLTSIFVVWFGFGELPKVLLIAYACFIPMYINVYAGIRTVDKKLIEMSRSLQAGQLSTIRHVVLPGSLPSALVGLRYALSLSVLALVIAETINTTNGLGYLAVQAQTYVQTPVLFSVILIYCLLGICGDLAVRLLEHRLLSYRTGMKD
jgi:sulfonate transport system permease protein